MADQIEINIYLKGDTRTQDKDTTTGTGGNVEGMSQLGDSKQTNKAGVQFGKYIASQTIGAFINNTRTLVTQNIGLITGRTELQERVNFGMTLAQKGANTYKNAILGSSAIENFTNSKLGAITGSVIGIVVTLMGEAINIGFKAHQLNVQENLENRQINQTLSRYGAGYNKSRSGL